MIQARPVPIKITQSENGVRMNDFKEKLLTACLSVATSGIVFCCGFMWNTNETLAKIEQHQIEQDKSNDDLNIKMNNLQLDVRSVRDDVIELKTLKKQK